MAVSIGARQYIPALGRWASPDPQFLLDPEAQLARPGERNLYRNAANSPIQHLDPTGHGWITLMSTPVRNRGNPAASLPSRSWREIPVRDLALISAA